MSLLFFKQQNKQQTTMPCKKPKGWKKESYRHSLAAKGIKTRSKKKKKKLGFYPYDPIEYEGFTKEHKDDVLVLLEDKSKPSTKNSYVVLTKNKDVSRTKIAYSKKHPDKNVYVTKGEYMPMRWLYYEVKEAK